MRMCPAPGHRPAPSDPISCFHLARNPRSPECARTPRCCIATLPLLAPWRGDQPHMPYLGDLRGCGGKPVAPLPGLGEIMAQAASHPFGPSGRRSMLRLTQRRPRYDRQRLASWPPQFRSTRATSPAAPGPEAEHRCCVRSCVWPVATRSRAWAGHGTDLAGLLLPLCHVSRLACACGRRRRGGASRTCAGSMALAISLCR